jgi:hypothetical protein
MCITNRESSRFSFVFCEYYNLTISKKLEIELKFI